MSEDHKHKIGLANSVSLVGNKRSERTKQKIRITMKGGKNDLWKGEDVSYIGAHIWVQRWKGKPSTCEKCGKANLTGHQIHWANIDHKYRRVLDDYIRLCARCHKEYDKSIPRRK